MRQRLRGGFDASYEPLRRMFLAGCLCGIGAAASITTAMAASAGGILAGVGKEPTIQRLADGIYLHTSWSAATAGGRLSSNGLIVIGRNGALLIDTAWTAGDTEILLERIDRLSSGAPLLAYATHAHADRLGGLDVVKRQGGRTLAHETTVAAAMSSGLPVPDESWSGEAMAFEIGDRQIELFHPGAAHTRDNTVVYVEDADLLYGGHMVHPDSGATTTVDAKPATRPQALARLIERFGYPALVVPGHGPVGNGDLLVHSLDVAGDSIA